MLLLDETLAALDPLARRDFLKNLLASATATQMTVVLSSHLIGDLARVCDQLVVIRDGRLRISGEIDRILGEHRWVSRAPQHTSRLPGVEVITETQHERHNALLVRTHQPLINPDLTPQTVTQ